MFGASGEKGVIQDATKAIQAGLNKKNLELKNSFLNEFYELYETFRKKSDGTDKTKNPATPDEFLEKLNNLPRKITTRGFLVSKYLCMKMLEVMYGSSDTAKRDHLMTLFCLYAMSSTNQSSFFIKIS